MKRVPIKRTSMTKKKTKRLDEFDREFAKMKPIVRERSRGRCEAMSLVQRYVIDVDANMNEVLLWFNGVECSHRATHVHHRKYRKRGGSNSLDNLLDVCEPHHSWIHAHGGFGATANLLGLALSAEQDEALPNLKGTS